MVYLIKNARYKRRYDICFITVYILIFFQIYQTDVKESWSYHNVSSTASHCSRFREKFLKGVGIIKITISTYY